MSSLDSVIEVFTFIPLGILPFPFRYQTDDSNGHTGPLLELTCPSRTVIEYFQGKGLFFLACGFRAVFRIGKSDFDFVLAYWSSAFLTIAA